MPKRLNNNVKFQIIGRITKSSNVKFLMEEGSWVTLLAQYLLDAHMEGIACYFERLIEVG